MGRVFSTQLVLLLLGIGLVVGCASSRSAENEAAARAAVVGTWEYRVQGFAPLDQGVFRISTDNGQLRGILQDRRLGRLRARVDVSDSHLELVFDDLRISGYIEDNQFTGYLRLQRWSVTARQWGRSQSQFRTASLFAQRVQSAVAGDKPSILECRSLLREVDDCD